MKSTLTLFLLIILAASFGAAQTNTSGQPDVSILKFDWKYAGYVRAETVKDYEPLNSKGPVGFKVARGTVYVFKYTLRAALKNAGAKTVKAAAWDFVFTDEKSGKEIKRFKVQSKQEILPGETEELAREVGLDPKENMQQLNAARQSVELVKLEYTDGSVWRSKQ